MLVQVRAAGINPLGWRRVRGTPYVMRLGEEPGKPKDPRLGIDPLTRYSAAKVARSLNT
jgi:hypothetical protein